MSAPRDFGRFPVWAKRLWPSILLAWLAAPAPSRAADPPPAGDEAPQEPKEEPAPAAGTDPKKAMDDLNQAVKANRDNLPALLVAVKAALGTLKDPKARGNATRILRNAFKEANPAALHAWALSRFPAPPPAEGEKPPANAQEAMDRLEIALRKETDPAARTTTAAKAASSFAEEKGKAEWAKAFLAEFGRMKPESQASWFEPPSGAPPAPPAAKAADVDGNGFALPVPGEEGEEPYEGFGANPGGRGGQTIQVGPTSSEVNAALTKAGVKNAVVNLSPGDYDGVRGGFEWENVTINGNGAAFWAHRLEPRGRNLVFRNLRLRNGGDNISFKAPADRILLTHVSTSGSMDDGMSISYGTKDATVQWCFFGGNTRSCFVKYSEGATRLSFHHNYLVKQWIRGPLLNKTFGDVRNNVQEDWWAWGGPRFESGSSGNAVNNAYVNNGWAPAKIDSTAYSYKNSGTVYIAGTLVIGFNPLLGRSDLDKPHPAAQVTTLDAEEALKVVREKAGCLPRDAVDQKLIGIEKWSIEDGDPLRPFVREGGKTVEGKVSLPDEATFKPGPHLPPPGMEAGQRGKYAQVPHPKTVPFDPAKLPPPPAKEPPAEPKPDTPEGKVGTPEAP